MSPVEIWGMPYFWQMKVACVPLPAPGAPNRISFIVFLGLLEYQLREHLSPVFAPRPAASGIRSRIAWGSPTLAYSISVPIWQR
jgi:hypothetical protein